LADYLEFPTLLQFRYIPAEKIPDKFGIELIGRGPLVSLNVIKFYRTGNFSQAGYYSSSKNQTSINKKNWFYRCLWCTYL